MLATPVLPPYMAPHGSYAAHTFQSPQAYALAQQSEATRKYEARGLTYAQHELLRQRKTPHGIITEEHDAFPADKTTYMPASKHVLLSRSTDLVGHHHEQRTRHSDPMHLSGGRNNGNHANSYPQPFRGSKAERSMWEAPGGMDSILYQTTPIPTQIHYLHPGSHVPTVLPSTLNSYLGPTASAAQQFYGPYWPDGTYSPYRPAPVRDYRFADREFDIGYLNSGGFQDIRPLRRPGRLPDTHSIQDYRHDGYLTHDQHVRQHGPANATYLPHDQLRDITWQRASGKTHGVPGCYEGANEPVSDSLESSNLLNFQELSIKPGQASDRVAFRDRTFTWAHHVYVELLAKVQRESRLCRTSGALGSTRSFNKPAIFPKPPQRVGSHFGDCAPNSGSRGQQLSRGFASSYSDDLNKRPQTAFRKSGRGAAEQAAAISSSHSTRPFHKLDPMPLSMRRGIEPPVLQSHVISTETIPMAAAMALDTVELLCQEANTPWTDGMLLAGCLAYGLGNYTKALQWYQRILNQDSNHVEARSNAAATLLALNQRDEALQYWYTAVKQRPTYFEAVEHLVGLLCSTQRAQEAVDIIEYVESSLRLCSKDSASGRRESPGDDSDIPSRASSTTTTASTDRAFFDYQLDRRLSATSTASEQQTPGFGTSGFAVPGVDNGRLLALIHAKGNMLYACGDNRGAARSFEDAILIATGKRDNGIRGLIAQILRSCVSHAETQEQSQLHEDSKEPILLSPDRAQQVAERMFPPNGDLPGLAHVSSELAHKAAISTTSNSLLSLAKIYQDGMSNPGSSITPRSNGTREILALYYLSLSLQRSPSTANNVGILLASVQQTASIQVVPQCLNKEIMNYTGVAPGSGIGLALQYYNYGLNIDPRHAHLYTNLGSLLKDLGHLNSAIKMYTKAVECDPKFDIALANLANAVKDQGRIADAINYYRRAVAANPDFAEAVCGLATALNSVCNWYGRGGVYADDGKRDRIHVDEYGMMHEAHKGFGWINRVVEIVDKQLKDGENWGVGVLTPATIEHICSQLTLVKSNAQGDVQGRLFSQVQASLRAWMGQRWEGARIVRLLERATRYIGWQWYQDRYKKGKEYPLRRYSRPTLPPALTSPTAPTVLPFHTFTTPLSAKQVRQISQRNALRISVSAMRSPWLPATVYAPPEPPAPCLRVGYVSSDFNNHPLAHLMQSIFGLHDSESVQAYCYATTGSDGSIHRQQIEKEAPVFHDASAWSVEKLVDQIVRDRIHILINLNGYTRGARNEVFAARPAPIHMSFMGFAGTLGAEWCDYVFADPISVSPNTLSPWRQNVGIEDRLRPETLIEDEENWMYGENIIFAKSTFFCVDHKQSAPDARSGPPPLRDRQLTEKAWCDEQERRWKMRKELFPALSDTAVIFGNFNQLYKIDPSTFRLYLRILAGVPNAILWLLRFPDVGEQNLMAFAREWAGPEVASRVVFTDVAPKEQHIVRASVVDLFLDTPECNAHTTAADVIWSGTPIVTWARWEYKMCSRMASSIVASAFPDGPAGDDARRDLLVRSEGEYERQAIGLGSGLRYPYDGNVGKGRGRLVDLRRILWEGRWSSKLFDTRRWVRDLETAYWKAWAKWEAGEGGDIWL